MARKAKDDLAIRFDAGRFLADARLRQLPLEVVGLYVGLFAVLKDSPRVGFLCDPIETALPMSSVQLSLLLGRTQDEVDRGMALILRVQLLTRSADDVLYDPEMVRQREQYLSKSKSGSAGGNTRVAKQTLLKQALKQVLEQKFKQTASTTQEEKSIDSFSSPEFFEDQNPIPGGQCAQGVANQAPHQGTDEILLKQVLKQVLKQNAENPDEILLKQVLKQIPAAGTPEREGAIARLSAFWAKRLGKRRKPDSPERLHATFSDLFDAGISEERMMAEMALGPSSVPLPRDLAEWPNDFARRLMGQLGHGVNSTQGTKEPAADPDAPERPFLTFHREFCACYTRVEPAKVLFWEALFTALNPVPTLDEYRHALRCFVNDPRRKGSEKGKPWVGLYADNAGPILVVYIQELRQGYAPESVASGPAAWLAAEQAKERKIG